MNKGLVETEKMFVEVVSKNKGNDISMPINPLTRQLIRSSVESSKNKKGMVPTGINYNDDLLKITLPANSNLEKELPFYIPAGAYVIIEEPDSIQIEIKLSQFPKFSAEPNNLQIPPSKVMATKDRSSTKKLAKNKNMQRQSYANQPITNVTESKVYEQHSKSTAAQLAEQGCSSVIMQTMDAFCSSQALLKSENERLKATNAEHMTRIQYLETQLMQLELKHKSLESKGRVATKPKVAKFRKKAADQIVAPKKKLSKKPVVKKIDESEKKQATHEQSKTAPICSVLDTEQSRSTPTSMTLNEKQSITAPFVATPVPDQAISAAIPATPPFIANDQDARCEIGNTLDCKRKFRNGGESQLQSKKENGQNKNEILNEQIPKKLLDAYNKISKDKIKPSGTCEMQKQEHLTVPLEATTKTENVSRASEKADSVVERPDKVFDLAAGLDPLRNYKQTFLWLGGGL